MTRDSMKGVVAAAAFALVSAAPPSAHADCVQAGDAVAFNQDLNGSLLFVKTSPFDDFTYFCSIIDARFEPTAIAATSNTNTVVVQGDAPSCPTSVPFRFIGNCTFIFLKP